MGEKVRLAAACAVAAALTLAASARASVVVVDDTFAEKRLGLDLIVAHDVNGTLTAADVSNGRLAWTTSNSSVPTYGFTTGALWARVTLLDQRTPPRPLSLSTPYAPLDHVIVCDDTGDGRRCSEAGDHVSRAAWPAASLHGIFPLAAARRHDILVRVTDASLQLPLDLRTAELEETTRLRDVAITAGYYALALGLIAYNFLLWLGLRARIYGLYVAFATVAASTFAAIDGTAYAVLWRDASNLNDRLGSALPTASAGTLLLFFRALVVDPNLSRRTHRALGIIAYGLFASLFGALLPWPIPLLFIANSLICAVAATLSVAGPRALRGDRAARVFLVAFTPSLGCALHAALNIAGIVPSPIELTTELKMASAVEFVLLSYALADRIKRLEADLLSAARGAHDQAERARLFQEAARLEAEGRAEELRRVDAAKTEFLTNVAHELRTPVHGVLGLAETVSQAVDRGSALGKASQTLRKTAEHLHGVVESILDFVDGSEGTDFPTASPVRLEAIAARELEKLAGSVAEGVSLRVDFPHDLPAISASEVAVARVARELFTNATKYTRKGSVDVRAAVVDRHVVLEISDTGVGIADDRLACIFEPFAQVDGSITRSVGGLGLGLTLVKRATDFYGATLSVESTFGVGTTVAVAWPISEFPAPTASQDEAMKRQSVHLSVRGHADLRPFETPPRETPLSNTTARVPTWEAGRRLRVLVVDDDATNRLVLNAFLADLGASVVEAVDGVAALEAFESDGAFDVVLLDVMMPRLSGFDVCRELRARHDAAELPIILLTAKTLPADIVEGFANGASDYVTKPFGKEELLARVGIHGEAARINRTMNCFVPHGSIELLGCTRIADVQLGASRNVDVAVLFADVHGFTTMAERLDPAAVFGRLNELYGVIAPVVRHYGGFIDKYIGDSVMAVFPSGGSAAVRAAVAMQVALDNAPSLDDVRLGIGIHAGSVLLGTLGEPERFEATVISDVVNVASRIEGASKQLGVSILASDRVMNDVDGGLARSRSMGPIQLKGRSDAIEVVELLPSTGRRSEDARIHSVAEFRVALEAFRAGDHARAAVLFGAIVDANPEDAPALFYMVECQHRMANGVGIGPLKLEQK